MKFITVTERTHTMFHEFSEIYLNVDHILEMRRSDGETIVTTTNRIIFVKETPKEIIEKTRGV